MAAQSSAHHTHGEAALYEGDGDALMSSATPSDHITLLPEPAQTLDKAGRIRILWGQQMLPDLLAGRYRSVICGVNDEDNSHGIIAQLVDLAKTSQWTPDSVTSYAKMFSESVNIHAAGDREPYVLKYDLDSLLILGILRPKGKKHFTLDDLSRGFQTIQRMLDGRRERQPVASVSFLGARSNRLVVSDQDTSEPSMETVLKTMYAAGSRCDVYPSPGMWSLGPVGVYPSYPFPEGLDRMRAGSS
ncbi:hypothetical protein JYT11_01110 [Planctomycetaceae bacterium AH-315-I19]|nr:hypothetical protein [Planctomycetaceae bacterium AH-315-I19]